MPDTLSQTQIDELLNSLSGGDASLQQPDMQCGGVRDYDFKSPKKLTKDQIKVLMGVCENFARHLASYFSGILRILCEVSVVSIEEQPYYEYNNSLPDTLMIGVMEAKPIEGNILIDFSNNISFALIDRQLGGSGEGSALNREFSEIETALMERIFKQITLFTDESWSGLLNTKSEFKQVETNARLTQSMAMDEVVVIVLMDVKIGSAHGSINLCIPCINLETIIDESNRSRIQAKRSEDTEHENKIREALTLHVRGSPMELKGVFEQTVLTLREVVNLQVGDVIRFDQSADRNIRLCIEDKTWFYGVPGIKHNKKAVKIIKVL